MKAFAEVGDEYIYVHASSKARRESSETAAAKSKTAKSKATKSK